MTNSQSNENRVSASDDQTMMSSEEQNATPDPGTGSSQGDATHLSQASSDIDGGDTTGVDENDAEDGATLVADDNDNESASDKEFGGTDGGTDGGSDAEDDATMMQETTEDEDDGDGSTAFMEADEESVDDDATMMDEQLAAPAEDFGDPQSDDDDQTIMDDDFGSDQADDADATIMDTELAEPAPAFATDSEATIMDADLGVPPSEDDATIVEDGMGDDRTMVETDDDESPTMVAEDESSTDGSSRTRGSTRRTTSKTTVGRSQTTRHAGRGKKARELPKQPDAKDRYEMIDNFARGGLGNIWKAQDVAIQREVAYKELLPKALKSANVIERFMEEAQVTGQLEHPGIVPIYDLGYKADGTPFYSMKLVRGETFEKYIEEHHELPRNCVERDLNLRKLLKNFIDTCNAMAFAHDRGVLHRDLKPLNVMIGAFGETLVLDWGLAKLIGESDLTLTRKEDEATNNTESPDSQQTDKTVVANVDQTVVAADQSNSGAIDGDGPTVIQAIRESNETVDAGKTKSSGAATDAGNATSDGGTHTHGTVSTNVRSSGSQTVMGSVMGTPAYMPPEQAKGQLDELDARTDIYSLGGILYKIISNQQPIPKGKITQVIKMVKENKIVPPRDHDPTIPKPLDAICMKALAAEKDDRYSSALDLAADVERWMADEPVSCFEDPWLVKAGRWAKRNKTLVITTVSVVVVLGISWVGYTAIRSNQIESARSDAQVKMTAAQVAVEKFNFVSAKRLLDGALGIVSQEETLISLKSSIQAQINGITELIRAKNEKQLDGVDTEDPKNFGQAENQLLAIIAELENEAKLEELKNRAEKMLTAVQGLIKEKVEISQAADKFGAFGDTMEKVRFHGSTLTGDAVDEDCQKAIMYAQKAIAMYGLDAKDALKETPQYHSDEHYWARTYESAKGDWPIDVLRRDAFELMLIVADCTNRLARNEEDEKRLDACREALEWTAKASRFGIDSKALHYHEANYHQILGNDNAKNAALAAIAKVKETTAQDNVLIAELLRKDVKFAEAMRNYQNAIELDPDNFPALAGLGICQLQLGNFDAAIATFTSCIALRPTFPWTLMFRGVSYGYMDQFDNAYADFQRAIDKDPKLFKIYINRGVIYFRQKSYMKAMADFETAIQLEPQSAAPHRNLGTVFGRQAAESKDIVESTQLYEKSLQEYTTAIQLSRNNPIVYKLRGEINRRLDRITNALDDLNQHIDLDPIISQTDETHLAIGEIYYDLDEFGKALKAFERCLLIQPKATRALIFRAETLNELAKAEERAGREARALFSRAVDAYSKFLAETNSQYVQDREYVELAYASRALLHVRSGHHRKAFSDYTLSIMLEPSPNILTKRGWKLVLNNLAFAEKDFQDAIDLIPGVNDADPYVGLAYVMALQNNLDGAVENAKIAKEAADKQLDARLKKQADGAKELGADLWELFFNLATVHSQIVARGGFKGKEFTAVHAVKSIELLTQTVKIGGPAERWMIFKALRDSALFGVRTRREYIAFLDGQFNSLMKEALEFQKMKMKEPQEQLNLAKSFLYLATAYSELVGLFSQSQQREQLAEMIKGMTARAVKLVGDSLSIAGPQQQVIIPLLQKDRLIPPILTPLKEALKKRAQQPPK